MAIGLQISVSEVTAMAAADMLKLRLRQTGGLVGWWAGGLMDWWTGGARADFRRASYESQSCAFHVGGAEKRERAPPGSASVTKSQ